jgi:predicted transcriptional regulator of viral defense system
MPQRATSGHRPDRDALYDLAAPQAGYFSIGQARGAGFSKQLLQFYLRDGRIERAGRGIFRLRQFPSTFGQEDLVPVWLWTGQVGVFSHETALSLHQLSDALPSKHHVTVPLAWRARRLRTPKGVVLYYADLRADEREWSGPVPVTTPLRTIEDAVRDRLDANWVIQATQQGVGRGLFARSAAVCAAARGEAAARGKEQAAS